VAGQNTFLGNLSQHHFCRDWSVFFGNLSNMVAIAAVQVPSENSLSET